MKQIDPWDIAKKERETFFFSENTMRFFGTKLHQTAYAADGSNLFFAPYSDKGPNGRQYKVACFLVEETSARHVYRTDLAKSTFKTMRAAVRLAKELAGG